MTPTVIVDYDGTLIAGNSLHVYLRRGLATLIRRGRLGRAARLCAAMALRLLQLSSHRRMKESAARLIGEIDISRQLRRMERRRVAELMEQYRARGYNILIASAAYAFYLRPAVDCHIVASEPGRPECRGEAKRARVGEWLAAHDSRAAVVITDHHDDLPLLTIPGLERICLVDPSARTIAACRAAGIEPENI